MIEFISAGVTVESPNSAEPIEILAPTTLSLNQSRITLIGANGSGKSTLARLINGLTIPTTGQVLVDGRDTILDGPVIRRDIGFIFADVEAQLVMPTPREDLELSLSRRKLKKNELHERIVEVLRRFDLHRLIDTPLQNLSGGQKQLIALASVLITKPKILICDEPTTRLDLYWKEIILEILQKLPQMIIHLTHDLDFAQKTERVLLIDSGSVQADGKGEDVVAHYRELMRTKLAERCAPDAI